jgi:Effector-associated domain 1
MSTDGERRSGIYSNAAHEQLSRGIADVLAKVSHGSKGARLIAKRAGFPREYIPEFETAITFWSEIVEEANHGRVSLRALVEEAARQFPHNQELLKFKKALNTAQTPDRPPFLWGAWTPATVVVFAIVGMLTSLGLAFFVLVIVAIILLLDLEIKVELHKSATAVTVATAGMSLMLYQTRPRTTIREESATPITEATATLSTKPKAQSPQPQTIYSSVPSATQLGMVEVTPSENPPATTHQGDSSSQSPQPSQPSLQPPGRLLLPQRLPPPPPPPLEPEIHWLDREPLCKGRTNKKGENIGYENVSMLDCAPKGTWHCRRGHIRHREAFQMTEAERLGHTVTQWFPDLLGRLADQANPGLNVVYLEQCCMRYGIDNDNGPRRKFEKCCIGVNYSVIWVEGKIMARAECREKPYYGISSHVKQVVPFYQHKDIPLVFPYE